MRLHHWYCENNCLYSGEYCISLDFSCGIACKKSGKYIGEFFDLEEAIKFCEGLFNE